MLIGRVLRMRTLVRKSEWKRPLSIIMRLSEIDIKSDLKAIQLEEGEFCKVGDGLWVT